MTKFKGLPEIATIAAFQQAALDWVFYSLQKSGVRVLLEGADDEDLSATNLQRSTSYKIITHVDKGRSPVVALWVYISSYDSSGSYGEWYTLIDGEWVGTEDWSEYDGDSGVYSWEV